MINKAGEMIKERVWTDKDEKAIRVLLVECRQCKRFKTERNSPSQGTYVSCQLSDKDCVAVMVSQMPKDGRPSVRCPGLINKR